MLDFFKDIFHAFKQSSSERVKNPFLGAFVFSWLGFNWPTVAIILFSKKDIIDRINEVDSKYDVGHFILAPCLTTIIICIILPWANQIFTKLQSKPNTQTAKTILDGKIDIAEKQLQIAVLDAKRATTKEREIKEIDNNIQYIIDRNDILTTENNSLRNDNISQSASIADLRRIETSLREANSSLQEEIKKSALSAATQKEVISDMRENLSSREYRIENQLAAIQKSKDDLEMVAREISRIDTPEAKRVVNSLLSYTQSITNETE